MALYKISNLITSVPNSFKKNTVDFDEAGGNQITRRKPSSQIDINSNSAYIKSRIAVEVGGMTDGEKCVPVILPKVSNFLCLVNNQQDFNKIRITTKLQPLSLRNYILYDAKVLKDDN